MAGTSVQQIPGDVVIKTISLFTDQGVVNMVEHVKDISIYESILTPGIIAELAVYDTKNISSMLPILGTEQLTITLQTPGRKDLSYDLIVVSFKDAIVSGNARTKGYMLTAMSPEVVRNKTNQVTKAYNTNVSNMVQDIINQYLKPKKKVDVQDTRGIQKIIIPSVQPFEAIKMLRKRAMSISDKSSSYVFFENNEGFHFKTLETLFTSGSVGDRVFTNNPTLHVDRTAPDFRNVISWEQPDQFDVVDRLEDGGLSRDVLKFDYKTLKYTRKTTKFNPSDFKNADGTLKNPDPSTMDQYKNASGGQTWVAHDSSNPDTFLADGLGPRASGTGVLGQGSILLHVFGDSELSAGQLMEVKLVESSTATEAPKEHHQLSGQYVIAFLRHMICTEGTNPRYTCSIEAVKGGYKETKA